MNPETPHLETLGRWVSQLEYEQLPPDTLRAARYQVLNLFAAARGATHSDEAASIRPAIDAMAGGAVAGGGRHSTIAGSSERYHPVDAALANAAYSMAHDFDDIVWMGHTCHSAVFASLAVAEHEQRDGRAFLTAVVAANEIAGRIGASTWLGPLNGQMVSFIHLVGAAAATAKLLNLDATQTTHAMAIALMQPTFVLQPGFMVPTSKLLVAASPTATGIRSAYLARAGMTGNPRILEDRRGLWNRFSFLPLPFMLGDLGEYWVLQSLTCKSYPGCHYFQTACEAIDAIVARRGRVALAEVESIEIATTKLGQAVTTFAAEYAATLDTGTIRAVNINFDLRTTAAVMLHAGKLTSAELRTDWLAAESAALHQWMERIQVHHDPALTAKVISSGRAVPMGRRALSELRLRDLPGLLRRYSAEYQMKATSARELGAFLLSFVGLGRLGRLGKKSAAPVTRLSANQQATPLYFPNRVTIRFTDGTTETEQVDLPAGSFAAASAELALEKKFVQELRPFLGSEGARQAFDAGLTLEQHPLSKFVIDAGFTAPPAPAPVEESA